MGSLVTFSTPPAYGDALTWTDPNLTSSQSLGIGNSVQSVFPFLLGSNPYTPPSPFSIYKSDWQGNQLQYSTPRTNILLYSQDFTNAVWTIAEVTLATGISAPDGSMNAQTLTDNAVASEHRVYQNIYQPQGVIQVFAKAGTANYIALSSGTTTTYAIFDLANGTIAASVGCTPSITPAGSGWGYLCSINETISTSGYFVINMGTTAANTVPSAGYAGTGSTVTIFGAHAAITPGAYIPTTSSPVTVTDYSYNLLASPLSDVTVTGGVSQDVAQSKMEDKDFRAHSLIFDPKTSNLELRRTPSILKTAQVSATSTTVWTPAAGKKFRLMGFSIVLSADATLATAGKTVLALVDNATAINMAFSFWVPAVALTSVLGTTNPLNFSLPGNGYLSLGANNALNVTLSVALATGKFSINLVGTEE